jgi:ubiquinol-cytochrome c reductase iron-sulfur subunit
VQRIAERRIAVLLLISILSGVGLFLVYFVLKGQTQVEGILFAVLFACLGTAVVLWGAKLLDAREWAEERHELSSGPEARRALEQAVGAEVGTALRRRGFLVRLLLGTGGALGLSLLLPVLSLGPAPGRSLKQTAWRKGMRVVDPDGTPLKLGDLPVDGFATVFPEGHVGEADAQALLIRVPNGLLQLPAARMAAAPQGHVVYSKICTHAGCPVGLYRALERSLICPCHQSQFDVLRGAKPFFGPAARPLPQLPVAVDQAGFLVAQGDFYEPVGPAFWNRSRS